MDLKNNAKQAAPASIKIRVNIFVRFLDARSFVRAVSVICFPIGQ